MTRADSLSPFPTIVQPTFTDATFPTNRLQLQNSNEVHCSQCDLNLVTMEKEDETVYFKLLLENIRFENSHLKSYAVIFY